MLNLSNQEIRPPYKKYPHIWISKIEDENRQRMGHATIRAIKISGGSVLATNIKVERVGSLAKEKYDTQVRDICNPNLIQALNSLSFKPMRFMAGGPFKI